MNIIALLESIPLDKSRIGSFTREEYAQVKKDLVAQQEINPEIQDIDIAQLLKALKTYAEAFQAVLNNRILFNFFAKKDHPRKYFSNDFSSVETEKVKAFVQLFFAEELTSFFTKNLAANKFEEISLLAEASEYFPDKLNFALRQHSLDNLEEAIAALKPPYGNLFKVLYIKDRHFFTFLSYIKDWEIERKVKELYEIAMNIYNHDYNSELANRTFVAMHNYTAFDQDFSKKIGDSKETADTKHDAYIPKRRNLTWVYFVVGGFILIRVIIFFVGFNFNNHRDDSYDDSTYDESVYQDEPRKIDRYYTDMKFSIDSFQTFLTNYKQSEIKQLKQDIKLKTGDNPFETFYQAEPTPDSNHYITVTNKTAYDMVILENAVMYDSIKMPRSAHFIKAGDNLEINFNSSYTGTIFNIYVGKKWSTFQTLTNKGLFVRRQSIVEYRFSNLIPDAKEILATDYNFLNDVTLTYADGSLNVDSEGATINPLKKYQED
jgi:hypothetical protein